MSQDTYAKPMKDVRRYITPDQIASIINAAASSSSWRRDRDVLLIAFLAYTGRRVGEVLNIRMKDILFDEEKILFSISKKKHETNKLKLIHPHLWKLLLEYIEKYELYEAEPYLFKSSWKEDGHLSDARVRQIIYKYCKEANIPDFEHKKKVHPHTLRHSFAVDTAKKLKTPSDLRKLQMILEHSRIDITTFYLQFSDDDQKEIIENLYT